MGLKSDYENQISLGLRFCDVEMNVLHFDKRKLERGMWHDYCSISIITNMSSVSRDLTVTQTMKIGGVALFYSHCAFDESEIAKFAGFV